MLCPSLTELRMSDISQCTGYRPYIEAVRTKLPDTFKVQFSVLSLTGNSSLTKGTGSQLCLSPGPLDDLRVNLEQGLR